MVPLPPPYKNINILLYQGADMCGSGHCIPCDIGSGGWRGISQDSLLSLKEN